MAGMFLMIGILGIAGGHNPRGLGPVLSLVVIGLPLVIGLGIRIVTRRSEPTTKR